MTYFKMVQHDSCTEYIIIYPDQVRELRVQYQPHPLPPDRHILVLFTQTQTFMNVISHLEDSRNVKVLNICRYRL